MRGRAGSPPLWLGLLAAIVLPALLVGATPHAHDLVNGTDETCVACHGADTPIAVSGVRSQPVSVASLPPRPATPRRAGDGFPAGRGSRAPPG